MLQIFVVALAAAIGAYLGFAVAAWQWDRRRKQEEQDACLRDHARGQPEEAEDEVTVVTYCDCPIPRFLQEYLLRDGGIIAPRPRRPH